MDEKRLIWLVETYAAMRSQTPGRVCRDIIGDAKLITRLRAGRSCTLRIANALISHISNLWPAAAEWPSDIPRPTPDGDSEPPAGAAGSVPPVPPPAPADAGVPARGSLSIAPPPASLKRAETSRPPRPITASSGGGATHPMGGVRAAQQAMRAATAAGDEDAVRSAQSAMFAAAMRLRRDGRLASPDALCRALGVRRQVYDDVVLRRRGSYYDHHPRPPADSAEGRVLLALEGAGDVRFSAAAA